MLTLLEALHDARTRQVALGHFNVSDLAGFHAVVDGGRRSKLPLMIGLSEGERDYVGVKEIALLVRIARERFGVSLYLNADHTRSLEKAREAAEAGFDEVIFDASRKPLEQNIQGTRQAVEILKSIKPDLIVEGEIGHIGASSEIVESVPAESLKLTTPEEAAQFVAETKVDVLAPAVGNMHGLLPSMVRGETRKHLDIERIRQISQATGVFLTLHGGSGTDDADFLAGIRAGLTIVHINTELRVAWRRGLENSLRAHAHEVTPYKILPGAEQAIENVVTARLALFIRTAASESSTSIVYRPTVRFECLCQRQSSGIYERNEPCHIRSYPDLPSPTISCRITRAHRAGLAKSRAMIPLS